MKKSLISKRCIAWLMALMVVAGGILAALPQKAEAAMVPCPSCGGSGKTLCTSCGGQGQKSCLMCGGTGGRMQQIMSGMDPITGMIRYTQMWQSCSGCGGSGRSFCSSCGGTGRTSCYRCGGVGMINDGSSTVTPTQPVTQPADEEETQTGTEETKKDECSDSEKKEESEKKEADPNKVKKGTVIDATEGVVYDECAPNLLDGKKATKFNFKATSGFIIWKAPEMIKVSSYEIMTGNDNATFTGRNPKSWVLYGSNKKLSRNSKSWQKVHYVTDDQKLQDKNYTRYTFKLKSAAKAYQYYKLEILENQGSDCTQMTEFTLKGKVIVSKETTLTSVKLKKTSLAVKWKKQSNVTGYQIQYSTSANFKSGTKVTVKGSSRASKTIKGLKAGKKYYVRIRTYREVNGGTIYSAWSKKAAS